MDPTFADEFADDGSRAKGERKLDIKRLLGFLAIAVGIGVLWNTPFIKPLKLFVVFLHEGSHALATVATGGKVVDIQIFLTEGGVARSLGGSRFWTLMAGYLGSLLWGGLILIIASRARLTRALAVGIGVAVALVTLAHVRNLSGFGFGAAFGGAMIAGGLLLREGFVNWMLRVIGLTSCLYAIYDISSDVLMRPEVGSDARMLAEYTSFPPFLPTTYQTIFWGLVWMALSIVATVAILRVAATKGSEETG